LTVRKQQSSPNRNTKPFSNLFPLCQATSLMNLGDNKHMRPWS